ncbi:hypothetical protein [Serratia marcescens]|uniref:hypothetical protein n=1 Tax=Serratia marcescens TaxID=615 RepID=UPI0034E84EAF
MATGNQNDMLNRLKSLLPPTWFGDNNPIRDAILSGAAQALAWCYTLYLYSQMQTRIKTASDGWLDMISADFFGDSLPRYSGQTDDNYRNKIIVNLFRERGTRHAISQVLFDLTGEYPDIFEPMRPEDTGGYGYGSGYGVAGGYGSKLMPYQALVTAYRAPNTGIPFIAGYASTTSGYSVASQGEYASLSMISGLVSDADIYAAVASVKVEGTLVWVRIKSNKPTAPTMIGIDYAIGVSSIY